MKKLQSSKISVLTEHSSFHPGFSIEETTVVSKKSPNIAVRTSLILLI
jgi:hypothetical protein